MKENISERSNLDKKIADQKNKRDGKCEFAENTHLSRFSSRAPLPGSLLLFLPFTYLLPDLN